MQSSSPRHIPDKTLKITELLTASLPNFIKCIKRSASEREKIKTHIDHPLGVSFSFWVFCCFAFMGWRGRMSGVSVEGGFNLVIDKLSQVRIV